MWLVFKQANIPSAWQLLQYITNELKELTLVVLHAYVFSFVSHDKKIMQSTLPMLTCTALMLFFVKARVTILIVHLK